MMAAAHEAASSGPAIQAARCSEYPRTFVVSAREETGKLESLRATGNVLLPEETLVILVEAVGASTVSRTNQERGPPSSFPG
jgi:hypothetical protein